MSIRIIPTSFAATSVALLATYEEGLCKPYCVESSLQPQVSVTYEAGVARFSGTTVFVPIKVVITVVTKAGCCGANTNLFTENFTLAFRSQTGLPRAVNISVPDRDIRPSCVKCGRANGLTINDSFIVSITPAATTATTPTETATPAN